MKIVALMGSPRKGSNTDIILDQILEGAKQKGHISEKIYLYDHNISPCIDCRQCKRGRYICVLEDEMKELYLRIERADLLIFGTPIYWYGPTAQMKLLIDRLRPFIANNKLKGKKGLVVAPSEEGPKACGPLVKMFQMSFEYLEMEFIGKFLPKAYERGEIKKNQKELKKAFNLGSSL